jgi:DNA polymerase
MQSCTACPLEQNTTQAVPGILVGDRADIMLIGEGPGADEDRLGKPFVGRAGQLLQTTLQELNITNNIYVTNIVKHRPPKNRKPLPSEMDTCGEKFLLREIFIREPKAIVCLGRTAAEYFFLQKKILVRHNYLANYHIGRIRGQTFEIESGVRRIPVFCTWHPAYILRNPALLDELKEDLRKACEISYYKQ